jgi:hypothetical protein
MVLLAPFTGCRLEEIGTLRPINVRSEQGIWFIAVEHDRAQVRAGQDQAEKSLWQSSLRLTVFDKLEGRTMDSSLLNLKARGADL